MSKYFWPASRLDENTMEHLYHIREALREKGIRKPITVLVKECVEIALRTATEELLEELEQST